MSVLVLAVLLLAAPAFAADRDAMLARGQALFRLQGCYGCHRVAKFGTPIGPDLTHVGARYSESYLARWLRDPEKLRPGAHMPILELDPADVEALAAWLATLR